MQPVWGISTMTVGPKAVLCKVCPTSTRSTVTTRVNTVTTCINTGTTCVNTVTTCVNTVKYEALAACTLPHTPSGSCNIHCHTPLPSPWLSPPHWCWRPLLWMRGRLEHCPGETTGRGRIGPPTLELECEDVRSGGGRRKSEHVSVGVWASSPEEEHIQHEATVSCFWVAEVTWPHAMSHVSIQCAYCWSIQSLLS